MKVSFSINLNKTIEDEVELMEQSKHVVGIIKNYIPLLALNNQKVAELLDELDGYKKYCSLEQNENDKYFTFNFCYNDEVCDTASASTSDDAPSMAQIAAELLNL